MSIFCSWWGSPWARTTTVPMGVQCSAYKKDTYPLSISLWIACRMKARTDMFFDSAKLLICSYSSSFTSRGTRLRLFFAYFRCACFWLSVYAIISPPFNCNYIMRIYTYLYTISTKYVRVFCKVCQLKDIRTYIKI